MRVKRVDLLGLGLLGLDGGALHVLNLGLDGENRLLSHLELLTDFLKLLGELLLELLVQHLSVIHAGKGPLPLSLGNLGSLGSLSLGNGDGLRLGIALGVEAGLTLSKSERRLLLLREALLLKLLLSGGLVALAIFAVAGASLSLWLSATNGLEGPRWVLEGPRGRSNCLFLGHCAWGLIGGLFRGGLLSQATHEGALRDAQIWQQKGPAGPAFSTKYGIFLADFFSIRLMRKVDMTRGRRAP